MAAKPSANLTRDERDESLEWAHNNSQLGLEKEPTMIAAKGTSIQNKSENPSWLVTDTESNKNGGNNNLSESFHKRR